LRRSLGAAAIAAAALVSTASAAPVVPIAPAPTVVKTSTLPGDGPDAVGLAAFQNSLLPGTADAAIPPTPPAGGPSRPDRLVNLGGIGSDLFKAPKGSGNELWMTTDRGPNGEDSGEGTGDTGFRSFPAPWFTPTILHVRASGPELKILDATPITGAGCKSTVGGLPNLGGTVLSPADGSEYDDPPLAYDLTMSPLVPFTQSGLDTEGLVRLRDGSFWFAEEYGPSIGHVSRKGCMLTRILPEGLPLDSGAALTPVEKAIPAIYQLRKKNRGFEALGLSPSGRHLFVGLQSPLLNPTTDAGNASLNTRILRYNLAKGSVDAEYVYRFQDASEYPADDGTDAAARPRDLKVSSIVALDDDTLLVLERTDLLAKVFLVELGGVTDVLGTWDCVGDTTESPFLGGVEVPECATTADNPSHEAVEQMSLDELAANGITPIASPGAKSLVATLDSRAGMPQKIEGIAVVDRTKLAIANDNDFNVLAGGDGVAFSTETGDMILRDPPLPSQVLRIKLDRPLPAGG
jgi:hypothetical protein